ncbi:MAG: hypothetical protein OEZ28_07650, partial [Nitrospinota bacterium]|nr:hypothetical protein [Nitrospinota bacterium]
MLRYGLPAIVLLFLSIQSAFAYEPVVLKEGVDHVRLGPQMDYLEDANGEWSIEDVTREPVADKFQPLLMAFPNFGFTRSAYWLRFEITNSTDKPIKLLLEQEMAWMNLVELYILDKTEQPDIRRAGVNYPFSEREFIHNHFLFALDLKHGESKTLYLKLECDLPIIAPLNIWEREAFWQSSNKLAYYYGFLFGSLLFAFLYNSFLFITLREWVYFCYSLLVASVFMLYFSTEGFAFQYLWPEYSQIVNRATISFSSMFSFSLLLFSSVFLDLKTYFPKLDKAFKTLMLIYALLIPVNLLNHDLASTISLPMVFANLVLILMLSAGLVSLISGNRSARFYVLGSTATFLGSSVNVAWSFGLTPANNIYYHAIGIGTLIDVILLSFALSDRVKILREEKEAAQVAVIDSERMAMENMAKAKDELEVKVEERTHELSMEKERAEQSKEQAEKAKEQAEQAKEQAEQANKLKDQFVTLVSHDLRAP